MEVFDWRDFFISTFALDPSLNHALDEDVVAEHRQHLLSHSGTASRRAR